MIRPRTTLLLLFTCFAFSMNCHTLKTDSQFHNRTRPNIIIILADDLGYGELGCYGQEKIETPHLDDLARMGMRFTQHYTGAPVCAPARAVLMTGKHSGHAYIRGNDEWPERGNPGDVWNYRKVAMDMTLEGQRPLPQNIATLPALLQNTGYRTAMIGKWGLGAPHTHSIPNKMGFDYFFGYNCQRQAHTYNPLHLYENETRYHLTLNDTIPPHSLLPAGADPGQESSYDRFRQAQYSPDIMFEKLMQFVKSNEKKPFFLYWASPIPHVPLQAPSDWVQYYLEKFGPEEAYSGERKPGSHNSGYFPCRHPHATYAAMISYLDENIGKLIAELKRSGELANTLIIFSSDNGPSYAGGTDSPWFHSARPFGSEYGRGKGFLYEGGIRVPLIASWPGVISAHSVSNHISAFQDMMPTICEVAGVDWAGDTDGISFKNAMLGTDEQEVHPYLYWEFPEYGGQVAVRTGKWKMIWKEIRNGNTHVELYDLETDPGEQADLAAMHPEIVSRLFQIIKREHSTPEIESFRMDEIERIYNMK